MTRYILSLIAALFITLSSFAQGSLPSRFNVSYLNMAAGMPNNFADDIFQDSYGFVWISTHGGGLVFTFSCSQVVDKEAFALAVFSGAAQTGRKVRILDRLNQPADHAVNIYHPEGEYLKGLLLYVE